MEPENTHMLHLLRAIFLFCESMDVKVHKNKLDILQVHQVKDVFFFNKFIQKPCS